MIELLNSRMPGGFLDHNFELKVCCPVMLLRKLLSGLVNRTRVLVRRLHAKVLECEVFTGTRYVQVVFIPRIPMVDMDMDNNKSSISCESLLPNDITQGKS